MDKSLFRLTNVQEVVRCAAQAIGEAASQAFVDGSDTDSADVAVESPIEAIFWYWWSAVGKIKDITGEGFGGVELWPQVDVVVNNKRYRLDFTVDIADVDFKWQAHLLGIPAWKIAVELDGHEFHERTKAQVTQRNRRDRDLQRAGWRVFHFSGSEVVRNGRACVEEVYRHCEAEYQPLWLRVLDAKRGSLRPSNTV